MPRLMRRSKRRSAGFTEHHVFELESGHGWPFLEPHECFHGDRAAQRDGWEKLRSTILRKWVAEKPGQRPWAWWEFDAPERRRCVSGVHPFDNSRRNQIIEECQQKYPASKADETKLHFGCPGYLLPKTGDFDAVYESEADYLSRLNLFDDDERDRVPKDGWRPHRGCHASH